MLIDHKKCTVLILDGDMVARSELSLKLREEGYAVIETDNPDNLPLIVKTEKVDLVLLDINLPGKDGLSLIRKLRVESNIGIILVTSRVDEIDRIVGLELGADDYVTKPYNARELLVRSKNLLRRVMASHQMERCDSIGRVLRFEGWQLDCHKRLLTAPGNQSIRLPEGEFKLLHALLNTPGRIFSRDQLLDAIRNREWTPNDRSVDVLVGRLRKKLCDNPSNPQFILTAHGAGYMFAGNMQ